MQSVVCSKSGWLDVTLTEVKLSELALLSVERREFRPHIADADRFLIQFSFSGKKRNVRTRSEEKTSIDRNKSCLHMCPCSFCLPSGLRASLFAPG